MPIYKGTTYHFTLIQIPLLLHQFTKNMKKKIFLVCIVIWCLLVGCSTFKQKPTKNYKVKEYDTIGSSTGDYVVIDSTMIKLIEYLRQEQHH